MGRKRANSTKDKKTAKVEEKPKHQPLKSLEGQYFQELIEVSNRYAATMKQKAQYEFIINKLNENRKKIQKGEIPLPVTLPLIPNVMYYKESEKKTVLKFFDEQLTGYKNSIKTLEGQIGHRYEEFCESAIRVREFLNRRFGDLKAKQIVPDRKTIKDEENLFEAEFQKLMDDPKTRAEFDKAKKEAIQKNVQRAKKTDKKVKK